MAELPLTPEPQAAAQPVAALLGHKAPEEALPMARLLVSKPDAELLAETEFQIRERVQALDAYASETAVHRRHQGATKGRAGAAPTATRRPASSSTAARASSACSARSAWRGPLPTAAAAAGAASPGTPPCASRRSG